MPQLALKPVTGRLPNLTEPVPPDHVKRTLENTIMNFSWTSLTQTQRTALRNLCNHGPRELPRDLGEQLTSLGLAEPALDGAYVVSPLGMTVAPAN